VDFTPLAAQKQTICSQGVQSKVEGGIFWQVDLYFYPPVFPASKIAGCRGIIPLLGEFEGATPTQGLGV
jgi:hypothetical protein